MKNKVVIMWLLICSKAKLTWMYMKRNYIKVRLRWVEFEISHQDDPAVVWLGGISLIKRMILLIVTAGVVCHLMHLGWVLPMIGGLTGWISSRYVSMQGG